MAIYLLLDKCVTEPLISYVTSLSGANENASWTRYFKTQNGLKKSIKLCTAKQSVVLTTVYLVSIKQ